MNANMQQNANFLFYTAWYSVDAYDKKTCILDVYWTAVVMAKKQRSNDLNWGGEREASFSKSLFLTKKWGRQANNYARFSMAN